MESFWSTMQRELLDRHRWQTRSELATAIFEWIGAFYNPLRRHRRKGVVAAVPKSPASRRGRIYRSYD